MRKVLAALMSVVCLCMLGCGGEDSKPNYSGDRNPYKNYLNAHVASGYYQFYLACEFLNGKVFDGIKKARDLAKDKEYVPINFDKDIFGITYVKEELIGTWECFPHSDDVRISDNYGYEYVYRGELNDGKPHGYGEISKVEQMNPRKYRKIYIGQFKNGRYDGVGATNINLYHRGENSYIGEYKDGYRHGEGIWYLKPLTRKNYIPGMTFDFICNVKDDPFGFRFTDDFWRVEVGVYDKELRNGQMNVYVLNNGKTPYHFCSYFKKETHLQKRKGYEGNFMIYDVNGNVIFNEVANDKRFSDFKRFFDKYYSVYSSEIDKENNKYLRLNTIDFLD